MKYHVEWTEYTNEKNINFEKYNFQYQLIASDETRLQLELELELQLESHVRS